jgi:hypothetical protein
MFTSNFKESPLTANCIADFQNWIEARMDRHTQVPIKEQASMIVINIVCLSISNKSQDFHFVVNFLTLLLNIKWNSPALRYLFQLYWISLRKLGNRTEISSGNLKGRRLHFGDQYEDANIILTRVSQNYNYKWIFGLEFTNSDSGKLADCFENNAESLGSKKVVDIFYSKEIIIFSNQVLYPGVTYYWTSKNN